MSRSPMFPGGRRGQVVDLERARAAIAQVVEDRDAVAHQLSRAHDMITSLRRQLQAREAEASDLGRTLRSVESTRSIGSQQEAQRQRQLLEQSTSDLQQIRQQLLHTQTQLRTIVLSRDEALAARDQERAIRQRLEAEHVELRQTAPDADRAQRLAADLANLRRHQDEVIQRGIRSETTRILTEVASTRDTVDRALASSDVGAGPWHDGLLAIRSKVDAVLRREGVTLLGRPGERFDPDLHEAVGTATGDMAGVVASVVSSGLMLEDSTVIQPARVIVTQ